MSFWLSEVGEVRDGLRGKIDARIFISAGRWLIGNLVVAGVVSWQTCRTGLVRLGLLVPLRQPVRVAAGQAVRFVVLLRRSRLLVLQGVSSGRLLGERHGEVGLERQ